MNLKDIRVIGTACLATTAGLVAAASLVLSAPATGLINDCAKAAQVGTAGSSLVTCEPTPPRGGVAINGSVVSGNATAANGSVASGCSTAVDESTASGGACAPTTRVTPAAAPAAAVSGNPSFAG